MQISINNNSPSSPSFGIKRFNTKSTSKRIAEIYTATTDAFFSSKKPVISGPTVQKFPVTSDAELRTGPQIWHAKR